MGSETMGKDVMSGLGTGLQIAGIFGQTKGAYEKSSLERTGYEFQSQVAKRNEGIARQQASDALTRGANTENVVRHRTAKLKGAQVADLAARNLDLGSGSALEILTSTDYMGEVDALKARDNANKEAWGYGVQADNYADNAALLNWRAGHQNPASDAMSTLLTGAGQVASSWYSMRNRISGSDSTYDYGGV